MEGQTYELLSAEDTLINIKMVKRGYMTQSDGARVLLPQFNGTATWIGALGLRLVDTDEVAVEKDEDEKLTGKPTHQLWLYGWFAFVRLAGLTEVRTLFVCSHGERTGA